MMINDSQSNYRWYVLILATLTFALVSTVPRMCMPVLFKEISEDLGLNLVEIGTVWGMIALAGVFMGLIGGLLVDYFGVRRTLIIVCFLAGVAGGLRGIAGDFFSLAATMFLFGAVASFIPKAGHKAAGIWFPQRLGLANGILSIGMTIGSMAGSMLSATVLSPLLGGWRKVMFLYAVPPVVLSLLWLVTGRERSDVGSPGSDAGTVPFRQAISRVFRSKRVWIIGLILMGQGGSMQGMSGYLPLYLRNIGWTPASADSVMGIRAGVSTIATVPMTLLSDRLGLRKGILVPALLISAICLGLLPLADGFGVWLLVIFFSICRSGMMALFLSMVMETEGIGGAYAGTAMGMTSTISMLGGFFSPPLGNSLADINLGLPFVFWAALSAVSLLGFLFIEERGRRKERAV